MSYVDRVVMLNVSNLGVAENWLDCTLPLAFLGLCLFFSPGNPVFRLTTFLVTLPWENGLYFPWISKNPVR